MLNFINLAIYNLVRLDLGSPTGVPPERIEPIGGKLAMRLPDCLIDVIVFEETENALKLNSNAPKQIHKFSRKNESSDGRCATFNLNSLF